MLVLRPSSYRAVAAAAAAAAAATDTVTATAETALLPNRVTNRGAERIEFRLPS